MSDVDAEKHDHVALKAISYLEQIGLAREVSSESGNWARLSEWINRKIATVSHLKREIDREYPVVALGASLVRKTA